VDRIPYMPEMEITGRRRSKASDHVVPDPVPDPNNVSVRWSEAPLKYCSSA
jgi:hypothetical protein